MASSALNQMIAMSGGGKLPDVGASLGRGMQLMAGMEDLKMAPMRRQEAEMRLAALARENQVGDDEFKMRDLAMDAIKIRPLLESGDVSRANVMIAERIQKVMQRGGDPSDTIAFRDALNSGQITPQQAAQELGLEIDAAQKAGILGGASDGGMFAPMAAMDAQGNPVFVQGSRSGGLQQIGGFRPYQPTYQEKTAADIDKERTKAGIDVGKAGRIAEIETEQAVSEQTQKSVNERQMNYIESGISAAEQLPNYDRMLELLDNVATGSAASLAQSAANVFGQASADYQELDAMMKQSILANIKQLGANPTEGERKFMLESTGDIRQSSETLRRLIQKYRQRAETAKKRGARLAESRGDRDALDLIRGVDKERQTGQGRRQGGQVMIDANGNRAMVYPDGSFEELP